MQGAMFARREPHVAPDGGGRGRSRAGGQEVRPRTIRLSLAGGSERARERVGLDTRGGRRDANRRGVPSRRALLVLSHIEERFGQIGTRKHVALREVERARYA